MKNNQDRQDKTALLIVDMIADFKFKDGEKLFNNALPVAKRIAHLKDRANRSSIPVIYVNDNYGQWKNDFAATLRAAESSSEGKQIVSVLRPGPDDFYILKPQRSGFFATPLSVLLESLEVSRLIVTGVTTDICVLFTAHDAHMRGFSVSVPADCCAAVEMSDHTIALKMLERVADADIGDSPKITFSKALAEGV